MIEFGKNCIVKLDGPGLALFCNKRKHLVVLWCGRDGKLYEMIESWDVDKVFNYLDALHEDLEKNLDQWEQFMRTMKPVGFWIWPDDN